MKTILVLLLPFALFGCEAEPDAPTQDTPPAAPAAQADPVAEMKKLGGSVKLDAKTGEVLEVNLNYRDAGLEHLKGLASLQVLYLANTQITDAELEHLKDLTSLWFITLNDSKQIADAGLEHLKGLTSLNSLGLRDTKITDAGLEHLKGLTSLKTLGLRDTKITDAGMAEIKATLPKCDVLK